MNNEVNRNVGRLGEPRYLVMGMDPGVASCGFALLDLNNHEILEMGSRLFDSPVHPKTKQSLAVIRRGFRSTRRNIDRTQDRLKHCLSCFKEHGLVPQDATKEYFHTVKGDLPPLALRKKGLDELLTPREWAMALYTLAKRRGYIPHGEGRADGSSEDGKVLKALETNRKVLAEGGYRTVGEWLYSLPQSRNRDGNYDKCIAHAQLIDEIHTLFKLQRAFGSEYAGEDFEQAYVENCDWERSRADFDRRTYDLVGYCTYFPTEKRAARCTLTSELVAAYAALGNITIVLNNHTTRGLTAEERDECIDILFACEPVGNKDSSVKFGALRKKLDLYSSECFKGIPADEEKNREVFKPKGWRAFRNTLLERNPELLHRLREDRDLADAVMEAVAYSSAAPVLAGKLAELPLSEDEQNALLSMPYSAKALNGYGNRSKRALDILLDCFEDPEILTLTQAEEASGLGAWRMQGTQLERSDRLMPYLSWVEKTGRTNNNPVVIRSMSQMRKVVNAVCRKWGVPDEIHVELDRELRLPKRAKDEIAKANRKNEKNRERLAKIAAEICGCGIELVTGKQIEKLRLWEEQENFDIYTGEHIDVKRLVTDGSYTQIDHVLPFSRTGDNSRHNKVLVLSASNQLKRELSPYEWMTSGKPGAPSWDAFKRRVEENSKLTRRKKDFLLETNLTEKEGDFQSRNFNDTAYMSREVCAYLSDCLLFPENGLKIHVIPNAGKATAWLRRQWGLNFGEAKEESKESSEKEESVKPVKPEWAREKDRSDDRHHAVDACVIAAISRSVIQKTAKVSRETHWKVTPGMTRDERRAVRMAALAETMPWREFARDVTKYRDLVIPTRFVPRKGTGELYEQTTYAYVVKEDEEGWDKDAKGRDLLRKAKTKKIKDEAAVAANAVVSEDGKSALKVSEMLCLRLWHDTEIKKKGKVVGGWFADPVYKVDIPAINDQTYIPKIAKRGYGRSTWKSVSETVQANGCIEIYLGDLVQIGELTARFAGFNIANMKWSFVDPLSKETVNMPSIASLSNELVPKVIREDTLGVLRGESLCREAI